MSEPTDPTIVIDEVNPESPRSPVVLGLAAVAVLLVGALVWLFLVAPLLRDDDGADVALTTAAPAEDQADGQPTAEPLEEPVDAVDELPLVTYEVFLARDPFDPVVPEPEPEVQETSATPEGDGDGDATDGDSPEFEVGDDESASDGANTTDRNDASAGSRTSGCTGEDEMVCDGRVVSLVDITEEDGELVAVVQVDTAIYDVREGEVFAGSFLVQKLTAEQVTLIYGDDVVPLKEGERVLK